MKFGTQHDSITNSSNISGSSAYSLPKGMAFSGTGHNKSSGGKSFADIPVPSESTRLLAHSVKLTRNTEEIGLSVIILHILSLKTLLYLYFHSVWCLIDRITNRTRT